MLTNEPTPAQELRLRANEPALGLSTDQWSVALREAEPDPVVGIRHAAILGDASDRFHVASIPTRVGCHFHRVGDEDYSVVQGSGVMLFGKVREAPGQPASVDRWQKLSVKTGDSFTIPGGYAHQLCADQGESLIIIFRCPDSHLRDDEDRTVLPDSPLVGSADKRVERTAKRRRSR